MVKLKFWLPLLLAGAVLALPCRLFSQDTLIKAGISPLFTFSADLADSIQSAPTPAQWLPDALQSNASWRYFWMIDEGVFGTDSTIAYRFANNGTHELKTKVRGRYSDTPEPPAMRISPGVSGAGTKVYPFLLDTIVSQNDQVRIFPNWTAARPGDTIYVALSVRNRADQTRSGYLKLLMPKNEFQLFGEVFPTKSVRFGTTSEQTVFDENGRVAGNLCEWRIDALPANQTQTLFIEVVPTTAARDSMAYLLEVDAQWDDELAAPATGVTSLFNIGPDQLKSGTVVYNPVYFNQESSTTIAINQARDPNALTVMPNTVPPANPAPVHTLTYRVDVENTGSATADFVDVDVLLDDRRFDVSASSISGVLNPHFPKSPTLSTVAHNLNTVSFHFENIGLAPGKFAGSAYSQGHFFFTVKTKSGATLSEGDEIRAKALIKMGATVAEDTVATAPAIVYVRTPKRQCYGSLLGVKFFNNLPNPEPVVNTGGALTLMVPLYRPKGNSLGSYTLQNKPKLFWQFELGIGTSTFDGLSDSARIKTNYVHLTPAQIRYTGGIIPSVTSFGFSAGYSLDFVYSAKENGQKLALKSGLGGHLEQELSASVDFFNLAAVPGIAVGAGYKYRWNTLKADPINYSFPFVYAQINFIHFHKRSVQVWNKLYRW